MLRIAENEVLIIDFCRNDYVLIRSLVFLFFESDKCNRARYMTIKIRAHVRCAWNGWKIFIIMQRSVAPKSSGRKKRITSKSNTYSTFMMSTKSTYHIVLASSIFHVIKMKNEDDRNPRINEFHAMLALTSNRLVFLHTHTHTVRMRWLWFN